MSLRDKARDYLADAFVEGIRAGGVLVSEEQANARIDEACAGCEYSGKVNPLPLIELDGCTYCGCPFRTKAFFERFKLGNHKVICPHPDGNKWAPIDERFKKP